MIDRYTHPEMGHIWTLENEFRTMLQVEILACEAMNKLGIVPDDALKDIQTKADFRLERIKEIEAVTNHDIIAFLTNVAEYVGDASKYIHKGLTSSDVKDTFRRDDETICRPFDEPSGKIPRSAETPRR